MKPPAQLLFVIFSLVLSTALSLFFGISSRPAVLLQNIGARSELLDPPLVATNGLNCLVTVLNNTGERVILEVVLGVTYLPTSGGNARSASLALTPVSIPAGQASQVGAPFNLPESPAWVRVEYVDLRLDGTSKRVGEVWACNYQIDSFGNPLPTATPLPPTPTPIPPTPMPPTPTRGPSATPAPPTLPPTPVPPRPGTLLYQAEWSNGLNGWTGPSNWKAVTGMLVSDGSVRNSVVFAPYRPPSPNYAIEVEMQLVGTTAANGILNYQIVARAVDTYGNVRGGQLGPGSAGIDGGPGVSFNPQGDWHLYRLEVRSNTSRLLINGRLIAERTDNAFLSPGRVGLWNDTCQINIRAFRVIAL